MYVSSARIVPSTSTSSVALAVVVRFVEPFVLSNRGEAVLYEPLVGAERGPSLRRRGSCGACRGEEMTA
ncbi:hypothetical protein [Halomicrococcus sp. SG-WS-1]|uniref:hypothetical protein n=1 Tax=Halomicrococcus sp. SG-WS-1 TaxID=3439057 RepID=UPI003F7A5A2F